jgi:hypothetical protein
MRPDPLVPTAWQELSLADRRTLRWRWVKSAAAMVLQGAVVLTVITFILLLLVAALTRDLHPVAALVPSLGLGFIGYLFFQGTAANRQCMGRLSNDLAAGRKGLVDACVTGTWTVENPRHRRSRQRVFDTPWRRWGNRHVVELRLAAGREPEEFEVSYDLHRRVAERDLVRAEVAPCSRLLLRIEKTSSCVPLDPTSA